MGAYSAPMDLDVYIHGVHAMSLEADPQEPPRLRPGPSMARVSVAWTGAEDIHAAQRWLRLCLPENGALDAYVERAANLLLAHRINAVPRLPETVLWGNADSEYPGAVSMSSDGAPPLPSTPVPLSQYPFVSDADMGVLLANAVHEARAGSNRGYGVTAHRARASLSGQRPKVSLSTRGDGAWCLGEPGCLNTWIVKVEDSPGLPGEAGVESVCQAAIGLVGVRAARTSARVLGGYQCVVSERSDRVEGADGFILPVHQEELRQAAGWGGGKYPTGIASEPRWKTVYQILRQHAATPDEACDEFTRLLACTWLLGHADLHFGNLGFIHEDGRVRLAPAYDVSSSVGTRYDKTLVLGVGGQRHPHRIGPAQWRAHARSCDLDSERVLGVVSEVTDTLPDAFARARTLGKSNDETRAARHVDSRCEKVARHIRLRGERFAREMARQGASRQTDADAACDGRSKGKEDAGPPV